MPNHRESGVSGMTISLQDNYAILASLHEGLFEVPYWSSFLEKLRAHTGADYASLVLRRADAGYKDVNISSSGDQVCRQDPFSGSDIARKLNLSYGSIETNTPYRLEEIVDVNDNRNLEYMNYLKGRAINHATVVRVTDPNECNSWLTIGRSREDFESWVRGFMAGIAPHLSIAVRTLAALEHERMRADIASYAVHRLDFGWLTFDAGGRVIDIDPEAENLFHNQPKLRGCTRHRKLPLDQPEQQRAFAEALAGYADKKHLRPCAVHLSNEPWLDMLLVPIRYRPVAGGRTPVAVGYVHGVGTASVDRRELLMQLFGLTNSEARLALAMCQGKSIGEAAEELNLTVETARNYTKRIYAKTDTRGNADLVRTILGSIISLT